MTISSNVQPKRRPKQKRGPWECQCRVNPGYLIRCPSCGETSSKR